MDNVGLRRRQAGEKNIAEPTGLWTGDVAFDKQLKTTKLREKLEKLKSDLVDQVDSQIADFLDEYSQDYDLDSSYVQNGEATKPKKKKGEPRDKVFVPRNSVLTDLFEVSHIQTIYHIFIAILIVFSLNTIIHDVFEKGRLVLDFDLIIWACGKFPLVVTTWLWMKGSAIALYPLFYYWSTTRNHYKVGIYDYLWLSLFVAYIFAFLILPVQAITENQIPPGSTLLLVTEQVRLVMKTYAFVRSNTTRALKYRPPVEGENSEGEGSDGQSSNDGPCPNFSNYLYFLFVPTLVYRDSYPRSPTINWRYVVTNFAQVAGCLIYLYYLLARFCVPVFRNFNHESVTLKQLLLSSFGCMLPGTLILLIAFFAILHSWLNAFAEMLRFADRLFYKDWWNSKSYAIWYRTWNCVVHDWLFTYVYKDISSLLKYLNIQCGRATPMAVVFLLSAIFHEYIVTMTMGFFYPVLFVMFGGIGFGFMFLGLKPTHQAWNVFMWITLMIGMGLLMCLYSLEWYARKNCPVTADSFLDKLIPRTWTCELRLWQNDLHPGVTGQ
ncbi:sterol O-acyltransferase 1 isoform X2 [Lingula anatina]|uniref:O-acyltransferase n=1 Tax=Lingula anatina TaxID=7574 RepID=A0A1S3GZ11_LINAN|nr:sterol O-acyltransferase 1 isoform X2 [Lingula anatina]|eukprot:XP_013378912.1 sterol O-acyltransferase 1 isoform X2 [Lingula anatina]